MTGNKEGAATTVASHRASLGLSQLEYATWLNTQLDRKYDRHKVSSWEAGNAKPPAVVIDLIFSTKSRTIRRPPKMVTVAVANQKGGVGKTAVSVNLAYYLATLGYRTLLADADSQGNATLHVGMTAAEVIERDAAGLTIFHSIAKGRGMADVVAPTFQENLFLAPAAISLANANLEIALNPANGTGSLRRRLAAISGDYDFTIIDCSPNLDALTVSALMATNYVLIPVQTQPHSLVAVPHLLSTIDAVGSGENYNIKILGMVPTYFKPRLTQDEASLGELQAYAGQYRIFNPIPNSTAYPQSAGAGRPLLAIDSRAPGRDVFYAIADALVDASAQAGEGAHVR